VSNDKNNNLETELNKNPIDRSDNQAPVSSDIQSVTSTFSADNSSALLQQQLLAQLQQSQQLNQPQDDEIDLGELWRAIWSGKITIVIISFLFTISSVFYALSQPNVYKASALLAPASSEGGAGGLAALAGQFGGLASMAGINLGGSSDKTALALEIIKSRSFIENFIARHDLLVPLMAAEKWDMVSDSLVFDKELYDQENKKWIRDVSPPKKIEPSSWEAYKKFSGLFSATQDTTTAMVTIEIEYYSPVIAQQWLIWLIADVNEFMREQDQQEAQDSINYLKRKLNHIEVASMATVFYQLIEEQTKNMMLTQVKAEYVLKTIDPPQVPDIKSGPKRALIILLGTFFGGILSVILVLIRYFSNNKG